MGLFFGEHAALSASAWFAGGEEKLLGSLECELLATSWIVTLNSPISMFYVVSLLYVLYVICCQCFYLCDVGSSSRPTGLSTLHTCAGPCVGERLPVPKMPWVVMCTARFPHLKNVFLQINGGGSFIPSLFLTREYWGSGVCKCMWIYVWYIDISAHTGAYKSIYGI